MINTYFETTDTPDQLSIKYTNLYYLDNQFWYLTADLKKNPPYVNKWTDTHAWRPNIKVFDSESSIQLFVAQNYPNLEHISLGILGDNLWYGNIGHALFDGLYPAYLAAVKFGYEDSPFVYLTNDWTNNRVTADEAVRLFSITKQIFNYNNINKNIVFDTLISGTGKTGNRVISKEYTLYGKKYNAIHQFKKRIMKTCGAECDKPINSPIRAIIVHNKRYSAEEKKVLNNVIDYFSNKQDVILLNYIDWSEFNCFSDQMKFLQDIDLYITGPGTGMMYMPFLKNGAININLGYMEHTQTNTARPNIKISNSHHNDHIFPGWMEQSVCAGSDYVSTLYYDRFKYNHISYDYLIDIIKNSIILMQSGEKTNTNHNVDAKVFIEYCNRADNADELCDYLTNKAFFIELFVHEHPYAIPPNIVDISLLRKIKDEFGMDRKYEIKT